MTDQEQIDHDKARIKHLGGAVKVAELMGFDPQGGVQRVQNWTTRGIPPKVKLERPDLFLTDFEPAPEEPAGA